MDDDDGPWGLCGLDEAVRRPGACRWFEGQKPHETVLDVALLAKVASRGSPQRARLHQPPHRLDEPQHRGRPSHPREPARPRRSRGARPRPETRAPPP